MSVKYEDKIINIGIFKLCLIFCGLASFVLMLLMEYDQEYTLTSVLPLIYVILLLVLVKGESFHGITSLIIILGYFFRMCILPLLLAYGNFYLEPDKNSYIEKYNVAIFAMGIENFVVFVSLVFWQKYFYKKRLKIIKSPFERIRLRNHSVSTIFIVILSILVIVTLLLHPQFIHYFHFLTDTNFDEIVNANVSFLSYRGTWYIYRRAILLLRPLVSFLTIYLLMSKNRSLGKISLTAMALFSIMIISEDRLVTILIGFICIYRLVVYVKSKLTKKAVLILAGASLIVAISYGFYGIYENPEMVARKFQRYFSGPTLTSMGLILDEVYGRSILDLFKLYISSTYILSSFITFDLSYISEQYISIFGYSKGIWNPFISGSIQYFGVLFPLTIILTVGFVVWCDYYSINLNNDFYRMILNYICVITIVLMIMGTVELVMRFILTDSLTYLLIIYFEKRLRKKKCIIANCLG